MKRVLFFVGLALLVFTAYVTAKTNNMVAEGPEAQTCLVLNREFKCNHY